MRLWTLPPAPEMLTAAGALLERHPHVRSAWLFGSILSERYGPGSDLDVALLCDQPLELAELCDLDEELGALFQNERVDLVQLAEASPVLRFEAISGSNLKRGDLELYLRFVSETCREYEEIMVVQRRSLAWRASSEARDVTRSSLAQSDAQPEDQTTSTALA
jgi:predicted nucleotidyltransferase